MSELTDDEMARWMDFVRRWVLVDDERGGSIEVPVLLNLIRGTVELEVSLEIIGRSREGWRAAVVVALGALAEKLELEGVVS